MILYSKRNLIPDRIEDIVAKFHELMKVKENQIQPLKYWNVRNLIFNGHGLNLDDPDYKKIFDEMTLINKKNLKIL